MNLDDKSSAQQVEESDQILELATDYGACHSYICLSKLEVQWYNVMHVRNGSMLAFVLPTQAFDFATK